MDEIRYFVDIGDLRAIQAERRASLSVKSKRYVITILFVYFNTPARKPLLDSREVVEELGCYADWTSRAPEHSSEGQ